MTPPKQSPLQPSQLSTDQEAELLRTRDISWANKVGTPSWKLARGMAKLGRLSLNPSDSHAIGIEIGRHSMLVLLIDFTGFICGRWHYTYEFAQPHIVLEHIATTLKLIATHLPEKHSNGLQGIGIAMPLNMDGWQQLLGRHNSDAHQYWVDINLADEIQQQTGLPVQVIKDTSAACIAELVLGHGQEHGDFFYLFFDTFIGGGLVINQHLHLGLHGNAGAFGSFPVKMSNAEKPIQLLDIASLHQLEQRYIDAQLDPQAAHDQRSMQMPFLSHTQAWINEAAPAIAQALLHATWLLDLGIGIIDGCCARTLQGAVIDVINQHLQQSNWEGIMPPRLMLGSIGEDACALGSALLPLYANYAPERDLFLKSVI